MKHSYGSTPKLIENNTNSSKSGKERVVVHKEESKSPICLKPEIIDEMNTDLNDLASSKAKWTMAKQYSSKADLTNQVMLSKLIRTKDPKLKE